MQFYCSEQMQNRELNTCKQDIYSFLHFLLPTNTEPFRGPAVFLFGRKRRRFVPQPPKNDFRPRAQNRITSVPKPLSAPKTRLLAGRAQNRSGRQKTVYRPLNPAF